MHSNFIDMPERGFERLIYEYDFLFFLLVEQLM